MATQDITSSAAITLPAVFVGEAPTPIGYKPPCPPESGLDYWRLPFVADYGSRETDAHDWTLPASGGYTGGYETGEAMALAFLKFLRDDPEDSDDLPPGLYGIVSSLMLRFEQEGGSAMARRSQSGDSFSSFRGQYVGFLNTITAWLAGAAKHLGGELDSITEDDLVRKANAGLGFDQIAYEAADKVACEAAKHESTGFSLTVDERMLLDLYRAAGLEGRKIAHSVLDGLARGAK